MEMNKVEDKQGEQERLVMIWTKSDLGWNQSGGNGGGRTGQIPGISYEQSGWNLETKQVRWMLRESGIPDNPLSVG